MNRHLRHLPDRTARHNLELARQLGRQTSESTTQRTHPNVVHVLRQNHVQPGGRLIRTIEEERGDQRSRNIVQTFCESSRLTKAQPSLYQNSGRARLMEINL